MKIFKIDRCGLGLKRKGMGSWCFAHQTDFFFLVSL